MNDEVLMKDSVSRIMSAVHEIGINEVLMAIQEINTLLELVEADDSEEIEFKAQYDAINEIASLPNGVGETFLREAKLNQDICSTQIIPHSVWDSRSQSLSYISHDPSLLETQEYHTFYATGSKYIIAQLKIINDQLEGFFVMTMPAILAVLYNGVTVDALISVIKNQQIKKKSSWFKKIFD